MSRWYRHRTWLLYPASFFVALVVWELVSRLLPSVVFASPLSVADQLAAGFASGEIPSAFANSLAHFALGLLLSFSVALPLGIWMGRSQTAYQMFNPVVSAIFSIPSIAFVPFIVIWFGLFFEARVALVFFMSVFDILVTVTAGARNIDPAAINAARSFQIRGFRRFRTVLVPASLPFVFTALRIGVVRSVNAMITAELFFAAVNLGEIMQAAASRFDAATMIGVVFLVSVFGLLAQELVRFSERKLLPWHVRGES